MTLYALQAVLLGALLFVALWTRIRVEPILFWIIGAWVFGVSAIFLLFGADGQLTFYSNDQEIHLFLLEKIEWGGRPLSVRDLLDRRYGYVGPAYLISQFGFDPVLALKFVSLVGYLLTWTIVRGFLARTKNDRTALIMLISCGPATFLFSLLALRETVLAAALTHVVLGKNLALRIGAIAFMGILRPHLAVAAVAGYLVWIVVLRIPRQLHALRLIGTTLLPLVASSMLFSFGLVALYRAQFAFRGWIFSRDVASKTLNNFFGTQFFAANLDAIERNLLELILTRLIVLDTLLIPTIFTVLLFVPALRFLEYRLLVASMLSFYVGVKTLTEFDSFRQNLAFIPSMATLSILAIRELRSVSAPDRADPPAVAVPSTRP